MSIVHLQLNKPLWTSLFVLSILAFVSGIAVIEFGHVWLTGSASPIGLWVLGALVAGFVALRVIEKLL